MKTPALYWHEIDSPVGRLLLAGDGDSLSQVYFQSGPRPLQPADDWLADGKPFRLAIRQLAEYFAGERRRFDLPLAPRGTEFQRRVWRALAEIPYGKTVSYGELARRIGKPSASRAVGLANGANPLPIIVPCHRVIGADGSLTGFGGGLPIKRKLLALERAARSAERPRTTRAPGTPPPGTGSGTASDEDDDPQASFKWAAPPRPSAAR